MLADGRIGRKFYLRSVLYPSLVGSFREDYTYKKSPHFSVDAKEMINPTNYFMLMDGAREDFVAKIQDYLLTKRKY